VVTLTLTGADRRAGVAPGGLKRRLPKRGPLALKHCVGRVVYGGRDLYQGEVVELGKWRIRVPTLATTSSRKGVIARANVGQLFLTRSLPGFSGKQGAGVITRRLFLCPAPALRLEPAGGQGHPRLRQARVGELPTNAPHLILCRPLAQASGWLLERPHDVTIGTRSPRGHSAVG